MKDSMDFFSPKTNISSLSKKLLSSTLSFALLGSSLLAEANTPLRVAGMLTGAGATAAQLNLHKKHYDDRFGAEARKPKLAADALDAAHDAVSIIIDYAESEHKRTNALSHAPALLRDLALLALKSQAVYKDIKAIQQKDAYEAPADDKTGTTLDNEKMMQLHRYGLPVGRGLFRVLPNGVELVCQESEMTERFRLVAKDIDALLYSFSHFLESKNFSKQRKLCALALAANAVVLLADQAGSFGQGTSTLPNPPAFDTTALEGQLKPLLAKLNAIGASSDPLDQEVKATVEADIEKEINALKDANKDNLDDAAFTALRDKVKAAAGKNADLRTYHFASLDGFNADNKTEADLKAMEARMQKLNDKYKAATQAQSEKDKLAAVANAIATRRTALGRNLANATKFTQNGAGGFSNDSQPLNKADRQALHTLVKNAVENNQKPENFAYKVTTNNGAGKDASDAVTLLFQVIAHNKFGTVGKQLTPTEQSSLTAIADRYFRKDQDGNLTLKGTEKEWGLGDEDFDNDVKTVQAVLDKLNK
ncbi:MAG: hypothetical protein H6679_05000 [Epsilonproteobacteria bacterium]|nr:hypothetical protein [Campylobacterota bacterium]